MKVAMLGDIHGNALALEVVLNEATSLGVEVLLVTGDLVGYYFEPARVIQLLDPWEKYVVGGNHEEMLKAARLDERFLGDIDARYGSGLRIALEQLTSEQIDWLCDLPHPLEVQLDDCRVLLCHGSPWDSDLYVYPDAAPDLLDRCAIESFDLTVLGHTHYPMMHQMGRSLLVNPGSVGQPRNRQPGAHWAILDTVTRHVEFKREDYDFVATAAEAAVRHPNLPYLAEVLVRT